MSSGVPRHLGASLSTLLCADPEIRFSEFVPPGATVTTRYPYTQAENPRLLVERDGMIVANVGVGDWLVRDGAGGLAVLTDAEFRAQYEVVTTEGGA